MSKDVDISVVILTFNVRDLLKECLHSVFNSIDKAKLKAEIFVVDNGSDGTDKMVANFFKRSVKYIANSNDSGFSESNNIALKKTSGKYILLLNSDTKVSLDTFDKVFDYMENNPDVGVVTCKVELPDGKLDGACHRAFPTPWNAFTRFTHLSKKFPKSRVFNQYNLGYEDINSIHEIDCCSGAFMFIRRTAVEGDSNHKRVGWLDEDYWANGEDIDWCYRFKQAGWNIRFVPTTSIIHYKGASSGTQISTRDISTADKEIKRRWINAFHDAMPTFYKKHYRKKYPFFMRWFVLIGVEVKRRIALKKLLNN